MGHMSKKKQKQAKEHKNVFVLLLAYVLCIMAGGFVTSGFLLPFAMVTDQVAESASPSLAVSNIDFNPNNLPQQSKMYAADGTTLIATFYTQNRIVVDLSHVSKYMQQAVVAREDRRFFQHSGVDVQGVLRAFVQTYVKGGDTQGGSTLTQQYVKNMLINQATENDDPIGAYHASEDTIARKLKEMLISLQLEQKYSKSEILQGYLNIAQFGTSVYGVETAAEHYFSKSAADLTLGEAATIASITKNPAAYDPTVNPDAAQKQRDIVLDLMVECGFVSQDEANAAKAENMSDMLHVKDVPVGCQTAGDAAFFCDYVVHQIENSDAFGQTAEERQKLLYQGGLTIYTTMDVDAENLANKAVRNGIPENDPSGFEAALASVEPGTGKVITLAINRTYNALATADGTETSINYAVDQKDGGGGGWQTGSTFKVINLTSWLANGYGARVPLPTAMAYDTGGFECNHEAQTTWSVHNFGGGTVNPETPEQALIMSHNTTQATLGQRLGLCKIADTATSLGYKNSSAATPDIHDTIAPTDLIGGHNGASPLTMATVFATIAAKGVHCDPIAITRVTNSSGQDMAVPSANCSQAVPENVAQTVAYIMNEGVQRGAATSAKLNNNVKTFAKTGTADNWYMLTGGFVTGLSTYVATGNEEKLESWDGMTINGRTRSFWDGSYIATPIWKEFMNAYIATGKVQHDDNYGTADQSLLSAQSNGTWTTTTTGYGMKQVKVS